jgi:hypothetical protein
VTAWPQAADEHARLLQVLPVRPTANIVFVQNQLRVDEVLGVRRRLEWKGLEVDADFRAMTPVEWVPGRGAALLRLSGHEGSFLEARVLTEGTGEPAVSSVSVLAAPDRARALRHQHGAEVVSSTSEAPGLLVTEASLASRAREETFPGVY